MQITLEKLEELHACEEGIDWYNEQGLTDLKEICTKLLDADDYEHYSWANWLVIKLMNKEQCMRYAIHAAELVLHIFEEKYPNDARPREAIEAAKAYLNNQNDIGTAMAASAAAWAAWGAGDGCAWAADRATRAARWATNAAAWAAGLSSDWNAWDASVAADAAWCAADERKLRNKIVNYGLELLEEK